MYPRVKLWGWNPNKLGTFHSCLLLQGRRINNNGRLIITLSSFQQLMAFVERSNKFPEKDYYYVSYEEILESIPQAECYCWTPTRIGILRSAQLISGKKSRSEKRNMVAKQSAIELINFTKERFEQIGRKPILE